MVHTLTYDVDASMLTRATCGLVAEASSIGLRPGHWPDRIKVGETVYFVDILTHPEDEFVAYTTFEGDQHLTILND